MKQSIVILLFCAVFFVGHRSVGEPSTTESDIAGVVQGQNAFAIDLFHHISEELSEEFSEELSEESGNLFFSPFSISTALAMTYAGARGRTESEIAEVLHFPVDQQQLHPALGALLSQLDPAAEDQSQQPRPYQLSLANRLWGQRGLTFLASFLQTCRDDYGSELYELDFAADPDKARLVINDWIASHTEQNILDLLLPGDVDLETLLVLTNAICFHGRWAQPFAEDATRQDPFYVTATQWVNIPMMYQQDEFAYAAFPHVELLQLPYQGNELAFVILLPKEGEGLAELAENLDPKLLKEWLSALRKQDMTVVLPKFELTSRFELKNILKAMGMVQAFDQSADFSGMIGRKRIWIDQVIHKAFIEVNEEGTEAAAATAVIMKRGPRPFRANRPFLFLIRDLRHDSILFLGRLVNPQAR